MNGTRQTPRTSTRQIAAPVTRVGATPLALLCCVAGALSQLKVQMIGEVYLTELMLPVLALIAFAAGGARGLFRQRVFWALALAGVVTLAGYVVSDLVRDTMAAQYLRGWGRVGLVVSGFVSAAVLVANDRRNLWWLVSGMGVCGVLYLRFVEHMPVSLWKFGYGVPMIMAMAAGAHFLPRRLTIAGFVVVALVSIQYDSRIYGAVCLGIASVLWARSARPALALTGLRRLWRLALPLSVAAVVLLYLLVWTESAWHAARHESSDFGRSVGLTVGVEAIKRSPLIGYGSWTNDRELSGLAARAYEDKAGYRVFGDDVLFVAHSQIVQAWMEGGVLGAAFFIVYGIWLVRSLKYAALDRALDSMTPVFLALLMFALWDLIMSPFSAPHRVPIVLACASLVALALERSGRFRPRQASVADGPQRAVPGAAG